MDILKRDIVNILEESKDIVEAGAFKLDLAYDITLDYNTCGSYTFSTQEARKSLANYTLHHPELLASVVGHYDINLDMNIGGNFFNKPEVFQVQVLIEVIRAIFFVDSDINNWVNEGEYVEDESVYMNLIDRLIEKISDNDFDLSSFLLD